ncbi:hypothetical protein [Haloplanus aerogenes]|uniref:DUF8120 domain-containing protein n=1 Tax=Haloplanus aerogenes TaxID=660522 RepID=A0A3M0CTR2_9EURY|nr:hypothetical protein [Haloplanus aerogenes]RMB12808.1 hypothetical protein ATH50_2962 [Haloplanus aerogenes]
MHLSPRAYFALDRTTKVVGLCAIAGGIAGAFGALSPLAIVGGLVVGVATVFVDAE